MLEVFAFLASKNGGRIEVLIEDAMPYLNGDGWCLTWIRSPSVFSVILHEGVTSQEQVDEIERAAIEGRDKQSVH